MPGVDLVTGAFLALRREFFSSQGEAAVFRLRDKRNTQDDPFDEHVAAILKGRLGDAECIRASGPLITPDLVVFRREACVSATRDDLRRDIERIAALEVKKLERTPAGTVARASGMDYNTTPPCGTVRLHGADDQPLDVRGFYLFVCLEPGAKRREWRVTALVLADGDVLNSDFQYYLSVVGERTKEVGVGSYANGANRLRPMVIFANPLGCPDLDHGAIMIRSEADLHTKTPHIRMTHRLMRTMRDRNAATFFAYRVADDVPAGWTAVTLVDPFPSPVRVPRTQGRGKFRIPITPSS